MLSPSDAEMAYKWLSSLAGLIMAPKDRRMLMFTQPLSKKIDLKENTTVNNSMVFELGESTIYLDRVC